MIRHGPRVPIIGNASIPWDSFNANQLNPSSLSHLLFRLIRSSCNWRHYMWGHSRLLGVLLCVIFYRRGDALARFLLLALRRHCLLFLTGGFRNVFRAGLCAFSSAAAKSNPGSRSIPGSLYNADSAPCGFGVAGDYGCNKPQIRTQGQDGRCYFWIATGLGLLIFVLALAFDRHEKITGWLVLSDVMPLAWMLWPASSRRERLVASGLLLLACLASVLSPPETQPFWVSEYLRADNLKSHRVLRRIAQLPDIRHYRVVVLDSAFRPR